MSGNKKLCLTRKVLSGFLEKIHVESFGLLCPGFDAGTHRIYPFDPTQEREALLRSWLRYRTPSLSTSTMSKRELVRHSVDDLETNGDFPPFSKFVRFDASSASVEFMTLWLSWYGATSFEDRPAAWWISRVRKLQAMMAEEEYIAEHSREQMRRRIALFLKGRRWMEQAMRTVDEMNNCFQGLTHDDMQLLVPHHTDEAQETPVLVPIDSYVPELGSMLPQEYTPSGTGSEEKPGFESTVKKIIAVFLDAAAVTAPIVLTKVIESHPDFENAIEKVLGKSTPDQHAASEFARNLKRNAVSYVLTKATERISGGNTLLMGMTTDVMNNLIPNRRKDRFSIPRSTLRAAAKKYLVDHPIIMSTVTDILIPSLQIKKPDR